MDAVVRPYKIRYGILEASELSKSAIVLNPGYGVRINDKYGSKPVGPDPVTRQQLQQKNQFYTRLEDSIESEGVRNPIFCYSIKEGTFCRYGTTRLWIAQKRNIQLPCIIADYVDRWTGLEELFTEEDILDKYPDKPGLIQLDWASMRIDKCPHIHLCQQ